MATGRPADGRTYHSFTGVQALEGPIGPITKRVFGPAAGPKKPIAGRQAEAALAGAGIVVAVTWLPGRRIA